MEHGTFWNILGKTVSHLARLFHIPQFGRGGGLRSRDATCIKTSPSTDQANFVNIDYLNQYQVQVWGLLKLR